MCIGKDKPARRVPDAEALAALAAVEDMSWRLLGEDEVAAIMTLCGRVSTARDRAQTEKKIISSYYHTHVLQEHFMAVIRESEI